MGEKLFFSGSHKDHSFIQPFTQRLQAMGYTTWWFADDQYAGLNYRRELRKRIEHCRAVVLVLSRHSVDSEEVDAEVLEARHWNRPIIPIRLDLSDGWITYDGYLRRLTYIDAREERDPLPALLKTLGLAPIEEPKPFHPYLVARQPYERLLKPSVSVLFVPIGANTSDPFTVCTIGRDHVENSIVYLDSEDTYISRIHHARISAHLDPSGIWQFILHPKYPAKTFVNSESLAGARLLQSGDLIEFSLRNGDRLGLLFGPQECTNEPSNPKNAQNIE